MAVSVGWGGGESWKEKNTQRSISQITEEYFHTKRADNLKRCPFNDLSHTGIEHCMETFEMTH